MRPLGAATVRIEITDEITLELADTVERVVDAYPGHSIELVVDTGGGRWDASVRIFENLMAHDKRVTAFIHKAHSGGALIVMASDYRQMDASGTFHLHWPSGAYGATSGFDEVADTKSRLMALGCRVPAKHLLKWMRGNTTISAKRALEIGMVDAVPGMSKPKLPVVFI